MGAHPPGMDLTRKLNLGVEAGSVLNIAAGVAIIAIAALQTRGLTAELFSGVLPGIALVVIAGWTAYDAARNGAKRSLLASAACLLIGVWLFAFPWYLDVTDTYFLASVLLGVGVVTVSTYEMYSAVAIQPQKPDRPAF